MNSFVRIVSNVEYVIHKYYKGSNKGKRHWTYNGKAKLVYNNWDIISAVFKHEKLVVSEKISYWVEIKNVDVIDQKIVKVAYDLSSTDLRS